MAKQWIMVRVPRVLADALEEIAESRELARQAGQWQGGERDGVEPKHAVIEMLVEHYHARKRRARASRRGWAARQRRMLVEQLQWEL